ncbi:MAG: glycoside hydrolase family 2 protein, partial [Bacteroidales bacterium]|nr:glycoside hydrolase family 2 protein [Bacteroidales bacterium]
MRKIFLLAAMLVAAIGASAQSEEVLLLGGWKFQKGAAKGAEAAQYNDSKWQQVTVPHDWAISGPFDKEIDKQVVAIVQNGEQEATEKTGRSGSLPWIGEGWYRTVMAIPDNYSHAELVFDGAMSEPTVYVDGNLAGYWAYGYNTFAIDITPYLPKNGDGKIAQGRYSLAVHLQNVEESSRWYPGAGIYRPVRLLLSQKTAVKTFGIFARTTSIDGISSDGLSARGARLAINTNLRIDGNKKVKVQHTLCDGTKALTTTELTDASDSHETMQVLTIENPKLWSPEQPYLYTLVTLVKEDDKVVDTQRTTVGIRTVEYAGEGFKLNGKLTKFRGVCLHHDLGPLGAAFNKAAFRRQLTLLKEIGCNAIRTAHNMPAPWQMDICDEMGVLVMAESCDMWVYPKCKNGYSKFFEQIDHQHPNADGHPWWLRDFENLVFVHRNHPSIVMWSIGNEIPDQGNATGLRYTRDIQCLIHSLDGTRPCTQGIDRGISAIWSGVFQATDVPGFNYRLHLYSRGHHDSPSGLLLGTETASTVSSRGVYKFPVAENHGDAYDDGQISSYDLESCIWSNLPDDDWMWQDKAPWVTGEFVWTGFDYLGEPTPYDEYWPSRSSYFGIFDLAGLPKDRAYLYKVHWAPNQPTLHVLPHWTWHGREGEETPVYCYTTYPEAELFVNGKSQGRLRHIDVSLEDYKANLIDVPTPWGDMTKFADPDAPADKNRLNRYRLRWNDVKYEPGEIKVVAYDNNGNKAAEKVVRTAGKPHHIVLQADRSSLSATPMKNGL